MDIRLINSDEFNTILHYFRHYEIITYSKDLEYIFYYHYYNHHIYTHNDELFKGFIIYHNHKCVLIWIKEKYRLQGLARILLNNFDITNIQYIDNYDKFWKKFGFIEKNNNRNMVKEDLVIIKKNLIIPKSYNINLKVIDKILANTECNNFIFILNKIFKNYKCRYLYQYIIDQMILNGEDLILYNTIILKYSVLIDIKKRLINEIEIKRNYISSKFTIDNVPIDYLSVVFYNNDICIENRLREAIKIKNELREAEMRAGALIREAEMRANQLLKDAEMNEYNEMNE